MRLTLGDIVVRGIDAVAVSDELGLIGRDVLNQLVVTLDGLALELSLTE